MKRSVSPETLPVRTKSQRTEINNNIDYPDASLNVARAPLVTMEDCSSETQENESDLSPTQEAVLSQQDQYDPNLPAKLFPLHPLLPAVQLRPDGLNDFGRDPARCVVAFDKSNFPQDKLCLISKVHFAIYQNEFLPGQWSIKDYSQNGIIVNGVRLNRGAGRPLANGDEIALAKKDVKVFCFISRDFLEDEEIAQKYLVGRQLGAGGLGAVYNCFAADSGRRYAMKIIKTRSCENEERARQALSEQMREVEILKRLSVDSLHPCIVRLFDVMLRPEKLLIVMEMCPGGDLFSRIQNEQHGMSEYHAKFIMLQVFLALEYMHRHNCIHRDIKPENILLLSDSSRPLVKVGDFGLSRIVSKSLAKTFVGTSSYIAPEVIAGRSNCVPYSEKVDCWSAGVVLYVSLARRLPFPPNDEQEVNIRHGRFSFKDPVWSRISETAKKLIKSLLTVDVTKRVSAQQATKDKWFQSVEQDVHKLLYGGSGPGVASSTA